MPISQVRKLRHSKIRDLPEATGLGGNRAEILGQAFNALC